MSLLVLLSICFSVKCHISKHNMFNISMGINNTRTLVLCGSSMNIYLLFDLKQVQTCSYLFIDDDIQILNMNISKKYFIVYHTDFFKMNYLIEDHSTVKF